MNVGESWEMTDGPNDPFPWIITILNVTDDRIFFLVLLCTDDHELEGTTMDMPLGWAEEVPSSWRLL